MWSSLWYVSLSCAGGVIVFSHDVERSLAKLRLQRLNPSVRCDDDSMTLHVHGSQVPNFLVETGKTGIWLVLYFLPQSSAQFEVTLSCSAMYS